MRIVDPVQHPVRAEDQLTARGEATDARIAHAQYFAGREADIMALWDSPRQREAYTWFFTDLANLRTAFRWAADRGDLDVAATIASYAALLGFCIESYEPIAWAEELIERARAVNHSRLATLYVMASLCWMAGRIDDGVRYGDAGQSVLGNSRDAPPHGVEGWLGAVYLAVGKPERWAELCSAQLARRNDNHVHIRACQVFGLAFAGAGEDARLATKGLIEAAEATRNPHLHSFALSAASFGLTDADPSGPLTPAAGVWRSLKPAATASTSRVWRPAWPA